MYTRRNFHNQDSKLETVKEKKCKFLAICKKYVFQITKIDK